MVQNNFFKWKDNTYDVIEYLMTQMFAIACKKAISDWLSVKTVLFFLKNENIHEAHVWKFENFATMIIRFIKWYSDNVLIRCNHFAVVEDWPSCYLFIAQGGTWN